MQSTGYFIDGQNKTINEELKELDEGHDGEAEPQTKNSSWVWDVLQQLKHTQVLSLTVDV